MLLLLALITLILISAFFSGAEVGMMSINRYRLRHMVRQKQRKALRVSRLLTRPDRLLGVILIGNTFTNILASAVATVFAVKLFGSVGVVVATVTLTLIVLIFAEVAPKTLAALYPQKVAFGVAWPLQMLLRLLSPFVWLVNGVANGLLRVLGVRLQQRNAEHLTSEELRTVVYETSGFASQRHRGMLLSILDLNKATVEDVMVARHDIVGIDLTDPWPTIAEQLHTSQYTRLPLYEGHIDEVKGFIYLRDLAKYLMSDDCNNKQALLAIAQTCYFVPEATPLHVQLLNFQKQRQRIALVVDEYGEVRGLLTLEDILEEIVGEFTTDVAELGGGIYPQKDGSVVVDAGLSVRVLNRTMQWQLPSNGPKTLSGLIIEHLQSMPEPATGVLIDDYPIEILQVKDNVIKSAKVSPRRLSNPP